MEEARATGSTARALRRCIQGPRAWTTTRLLLWLAPACLARYWSHMGWRRRSLVAQQMQTLQAGWCCVDQEQACRLNMRILALKILQSAPFFLRDSRMAARPAASPPWRDCGSVCSMPAVWKRYIL